MKTTLQGLFLITGICFCFFLLFRCQLKPSCKYAIHGIDVSKWQGTVDWKTVKKTDVKFVFIKATEGETLQDTYFKKNWRGLEKEGIMRGAYHFYRPSVLAKKQAQNFIKTVRLKKGDFPPVLDLEETDDRSKAIILKGVKNWLNEVERHYGVKPIIYVNRSFYHDYVKGNFDDYPIWVAAYTWRTPMLGKQWKFWQYSDKGKKQGISGDVDLNIFDGTIEELMELGIK